MSCTANIPRKQEDRTHKLRGEKTASGCAAVGSEDRCRAMTSSPVPMSQRRRLCSVPHLISAILAAQRKHDDLKEKCEIGHEVPLSGERAPWSIFLGSN